MVEMSKRPGVQAAVMTALTLEQLQDVVAQAVRAELGGTAAQSEYLTTEQVGELLQASTKTVQKWVERDGLPALRVGREYRFKRDAVIAWLEARCTTPGGHHNRHSERLRQAR